MKYLQSFGTALVQWFDTDYFPEGAQKVRDQPDRFDWGRAMSFIFLHAGCLLVLLSGWSWTAVGIAAALYFVRMFAVTGLYHRYFSHRSFRTSRGGQFFFALMVGTCIQRGVLWWASTHRHHHRHSDEEEDVHSPGMRGFWWSHIGWMTSSRNFPTDYTRVRDLARYPELVFLNRFDLIVPAVYGLALFGFGAALNFFFPALGVSGFQIFVWGFFISTIFLLHGTLFINSLAHVYGNRRFDTGDDSRNSLLLALITLGEGWHNNHHHYMNSARQGFYWWEIDITFYILKMMSWTGLIWELRPVPERVYRQANGLAVATDEEDDLVGLPPVNSDIA